MIFFLAIQASTCFGGTVVFLHGKGSTGRTSICNEFEKLPESWKVISDDAIYIEQLALSFKEEFPKEFELVADGIEASNIFHATLRNQALYKTYASEEKRDKSRKAIQVIQANLNCRKNE